MPPTPAGISTHILFPAEDRLFMSLELVGRHPGVVLPILPV